ncbi:MAG: BT4734/BF3469 family protein [Parabacteroides sp.]|nr:BT4734/BF3469 family protein [Parabacteroides sp.]
MKVTRFSGDGKTQKSVELSELIESMKTDGKGSPVSRLRQQIKESIRGIRCDSADKLPVITFATTFRNHNEQMRFSGYNGLILLEVNRLMNNDEARRVRDLASESLQTMVAFIGSGGRSVKIVVPFTLPDGTLPQNEKQAELFHAHAYRRAAAYYKEQLQKHVEIKKPGLQRGCRISVDPSLYYNPLAASIQMKQPLQLPDEVTYTETVNKETDPLLRMMPGLERSRIISLLFESCLKDAMETTGITANDKDPKPFLIRLAENCFRSAIPEEDVIKWSLVHTPFNRFDPELRATVRTTYEVGKNFGGNPCVNKARTLIMQLEEFMQRRYEFRRNIIRGDVEYRERESFYFDFKPVTEEELNGIGIMAHKEEIEVWDRDVKRYVFSNKIPTYNPIDDYLDSLPEWDGKDRIRPLAGTITCTNPKWSELFYIWFLSMVAHWKQMDQSHANSSLPLLIGDQGCGKSTWCRNLLPLELREYYTDSIDLSNKRNAELALNRYALINIDEYDSIKSKDQSFLKHLLQKPELNTRLPFKRSAGILKRYASFIATCNNFDLLTDPTGSRRYLCIEIQGTINHSHPVDHAQLYAQAISALRAGQRYWFTKEEETETTESNTQFQQIPLEEQLFHQHFRAPVNDEEGEYLPAIEILQLLQQRSKTKFSNTSMNSFGRLLLKNKIPKKHTNAGNVYRVVDRNN